MSAVEQGALHAAAPAARPKTARRVPLVARALETLLVICLFLFMLGPLIWLAVRAFAAVWFFPRMLPNSWSLEWWRTVFDSPQFMHSVRLSFEFAPTVTIISAAICIPAAYAFSRYRFPGRRTLLISLFATNAFPKFGLYVSMAGFFYSLNLMGKFLGVVIVQLIGTIVFMTWIPTAAFSAVPRSLEDAARDVGAGPLRVFFRVTFPLAAPGILVAIILSFLAAFDEAQGTFLVGVPNYITMPTQMYTLVIDYPQQVAAVFSILLAIPSVVLMGFARKHVMGGRLAEGFQIR